MSATVITVENLSKRYVIGHQRDLRDGLRHRMEQAFRAPWQWLKAKHKEQRAVKEEFWALKDVSFKVEQGDVLGIIGRNGAGKSTLLKVLSQITEPTNGRVRIEGRVASLLEVGTGFHQELTGRENIFLNGAILGMSRTEIKKRFDEIVAFSEVEKFLDTPVKRYSSGMYVRLAFAVAAHLEPEILIIDEVLAVGDAGFQKKCLGKLGEVAMGGRTVLFVSHNMPAVTALCNKAILLQAGTLKSAGAVQPLIADYLKETGVSSNRRNPSIIDVGDALQLVNIKSNPNPVETGKSLRLSMQFLAKKTTTINELAILIFTQQNTRVAILDLRSYGLPARLQAGETWEIGGQIPSLPLVEGDYSIGLYVNAAGVVTDLLDLNTISVQSRLGNRSVAPYPAAYRGVVELDFSHCESIVRPAALQTSAEEQGIGQQKLGTATNAALNSRIEP